MRIALHPPQQAASLALSVLPLQRKPAVSMPGDPFEREADATAEKVMNMDAPGPTLRAAGGSMSPAAGEPGTQAARGFDFSHVRIPPASIPPIPHSVEQELARPGVPLHPALRHDMEGRFGYDFSRVRIHADETAAGSARDVRANAYTTGDNIVFGSGKFAPETRNGKRLIAHELTHVIQQSRNAPIVIAREPSDDADAQVSLGYLDSSAAGKAGAAVIGEAQWVVLREFLRGLTAGVKFLPPEQRQRIEDKFKNEGFFDSLKYAGGYAVGIIEGIGTSIKGLFEAVITLFKIPFIIGRFMAVTLPDLAAKYGPRIEQFLTEGDGLQVRIAQAVGKFLASPRQSINQIKALLDSVGQLALSKVRALGHGAANRTLAFLQEPWYEYGRDIGQVVGQILFEVILAVFSEAIANVVKEALVAVGRLTARVVTGAVEIIRSVGRYLGEGIEWLTRIGGKLSGEMGELFESVKAFLGKLRALMAEMGEEGALADTGAGGVKAPIPDAKPPVLESRALKPPRTSPAKVSDLTPPKVHPSNVPKEIPAPKGAVADEAAGEASPTTKVKSPALQYRDNLVKRYPKLDGANLKPIGRNLGEPGLWEESVYTGSGKQSWSAELRDGRRIQLDDIDPSGNIVDTKMRGIDAGREIPHPKVPDVVDELGGAKAGRQFAAFPEKEQEKLLRQLKFAQENGLNGVRWETNSATLLEEVNRFAEISLTNAERNLFKIILVQR